VEKIEVASSQEFLVLAVSKLNAWLNLGYDTIAVICRDEVEAKQVQRQLMAYLPVQESSLENAVFNKGIMVLPIKLTKGLEFDTVLLWNPVKENYKKSDANAKLLYVAVTRALHELTIVFQGVLSPLL
jgi:DNA helicase-2/ATP-dependent DNA helicase PcrA